MSTGLAARQELQLSPGGQKRQNMKLRLFNYLLASIPIVPGVFAQEPPVPIAPFALRFEEITKSLVQWIDDDPEFGMISATADTSGVWTLSLLSKDMKQVDYYTDHEDTAKGLRALGLAAHVTPLDVKVPKDDREGTQYGFAFADKNGKSVLWRFVIGQGGVTERGSGLDVIRANGLRLVNRSKGATAGSGSAVKLGDRLSEAQVWKQVSAPPFFTAYHGALSVGEQATEFATGRRNWNVISSPSDVRPNETWRLRDNSNLERTLRVLNTSAQSITVDQSGSDPADNGRYTYARANNGYSLRQIVMDRGSHILRVEIAPDGNLRVDLDRKSGFAKGFLSTTAPGSGSEMLLEFMAPEAARRLKLRLSVQASPDSITTDSAIVP
jgi:hypothetical protein